MEFECPEEPTTWWQMKVIKSLRIYQLIINTF